MDLSIGVLDLQIESVKACSVYETTCTKFSLSFSLQGAFLKAALSEDLSDTVDYDALARDLKNHLSIADCSNPQALLAQAKSRIRQYSAKITGGYVSVHIQCHKPFTVEKALL